MRRTLTIGLWLGVLALAPFASMQGAAEELRAQETVSNAAEAHLAAGMAAYWRLHFQEAERHFQAAVDADPGRAAPLFYLGYTVYKIAEPKRPDDPGKHRAAELFARAYAIDPGFKPDWRVSGRR